MKPQRRYRPGDKIGGRYQVHQDLMDGMGRVIPRITALFAQVEVIETAVEVAPRQVAPKAQVAPPAPSTPNSFPKLLKPIPCPFYSNESKPNKPNSPHQKRRSPGETSPG